MEENRKYFVQLAFVLVGLIYALKLFQLQVLDNSYKLAAEDNVIRRIIEYPYRGLIYDRNHNLLVHNEPVFDLMVVPKEVEVDDTVKFCSLLNITKRRISAKNEGSQGF